MIGSRDLLENMRNARVEVPVDRALMTRMLIFFRDVTISFIHERRERINPATAMANVTFTLTEEVGSNSKQSAPFPGIITHEMEGGQIEMMGRQR